MGKKIHTKISDFLNSKKPEYLYHGTSKGAVFGNEWKKLNNCDVIFNEPIIS